MHKQGKNKKQAKQSSNNNQNHNQNRKTKQIFVGGCHPKIQNDQLKEYFSKYGKVIESKLVKDKKTKRFRGFAFVTFHEFSTVEKVLKEEHIILGKKVDLKKAFTKEQTRDKLIREKQRKIYITGIPKTMERKTIAKYFSKFGKVEDTRIILDRYKTKYKGFGFVLFKSDKSLAKVLKSGHSHKVGGVILDCRQTMLREELRYGVQVLPGGKAIKSSEKGKNENSLKAQNNNSEKIETNKDTTNSKHKAKEKIANSKAKHKSIRKRSVPFHPPEENEIINIMPTTNSQTEKELPSSSFRFNPPELSISEPPLPRHRNCNYQWNLPLTQPYSGPQLYAQYHPQTNTEIVYPEFQSYGFSSNHNGFANSFHKQVELRFYPPQLDKSQINTNLSPYIEKQGSSSAVEENSESNTSYLTPPEEQTRPENNELHQGDETEKDGFDRRNKLGSEVFSYSSYGARQKDNSNGKLPTEKFCTPNLSHKREYLIFSNSQNGLMGYRSPQITSSSSNNSNSQNNGGQKIPTQVSSDNPHQVHQNQYLNLPHLSNPQLPAQAQDTIPSKPNSDLSKVSYETPKGFQMQREVTFNTRSENLYQVKKSTNSLGSHFSLKTDFPMKNKNSTQDEDELRTNCARISETKEYDLKEPLKMLSPGRKDRLGINTSKNVS